MLRKVGAQLVAHPHQDGIGAEHSHFVESLRKGLHLQEGLQVGRPQGERGIAHERDAHLLVGSGHKGVLPIEIGQRTASGCHIEIGEGHRLAGLGIDEPSTVLLLLCQHQMCQHKEK